MKNIKYLEQLDLICAWRELMERIECEVPYIQYQDEWDEQPYFLEDERPWPCPAIFHEQEATVLQDLANGLQLLSVNFNLYLVTEVVADSGSFSTSAELALRYGKLKRELHTKLHNWSGTALQSLTRTGMTKLDRVGAMRVDLLTFNGLVVDASAVPAKNMVDLSTLLEDDEEGTLTRFVEGALEVSDEPIPANTDTPHFQIRMTPLSNE